MSSKRKSGGPPPPGQRSISSFFSTKPQPKPAARPETPSPALGAGKPPISNTPVKSPARRVASKASFAPEDTPPMSPPAVTRQTRASASPAAAKKATPAPDRTPKKAPVKTPVKTPVKAQIKSPVKAATKASIKSPRQGSASKAASQARKESPAKGAPSESLTGRRVRVWWPAEKEWFEGQVGARRGGSSKYSVEYDDGDQEVVDFNKEKHELMAAGSKPPPRKAARKSHTVLSESDDDSEDGGGKATMMDADSASESGSEFGPANAESDSDSDESMADSEGDASGDSENEEPMQRKGAKVSVKRKVTVSSTPATVSAKKARTEDDGLPVSDSKPVRTPVTQPGAKAKLVSVFGKLTPAAATPVGTTPGLATPVSADIERYAARSGERFPFLAPSRIKDAAGVRPGEPGYNARTLNIPKTWFKDQKISPGQQQWWEIKAKNFDSVLLFKMGKFYEMFEMDSHVGVEVLGLVLMKGDQPHCGFPEVNYHMHAERLARAGLRVVVVEQSETPAQLAVRNEERRRQKLPKMTVVNREMVAVLTTGTMTDAEMLQSHPDASYLMAITESPAVPSADSIDAEPVTIGVCAVDAATGQMVLGQWTDGDLRAQLRGHLSALQPVELVVPAGGLSATTWKVLRGVLRSPRVNELVPDKEFWGAERIVKEIQKADYFGASPDSDADMGGSQKYPAALQALLLGNADSSAALSALGGAIFYLRQVLLDRAVLPLGRMELLPDTEGAAPQAGGDDGSEVAGPEFVRLDAAALENLEVLENSTGGTEGTLLAAVENCATPAGRRLLRQWLVRPLARVAAIVKRQDAVAALMGPAQEAASRARKQFAGVLDLERALARLRAAGTGATARDAAHIVLYEDAAKRRVAALVAALRGLRTIQGAMQEFDGETYDSELLESLVTPGHRFPDVSAALADLEAATNWEEAEANGRVVPREGVDKNYDAAEADLQAADRQLKDFLKEVRAKLGAGKDVAYVSVNKETHLIEIPEEFARRVPADFELLAQRKGFKRYMCPALRDAVTDRATAIAAREECLNGSLQTLMHRFTASHALWQRAVSAMAQLDALMSLASAAAFADGPMCRPTFLPAPAPDSGVSPAFKACALRHPAAAELHTACFVPNDVSLGGSAAPFIVLTGPNMGGKSTLLRQVCLAALLAHTGAWVPAQSLSMSPVDALFVRMGARDNIFGGQSTFLLELSETAALLNSATHNSLVALDELGRGTSTSDGAAIAGAVLEHLTSSVGCRGLFATHYHRLADDHVSDPAVDIRHMGCAVEEGTDGMPETVTFLYTMAEGACPKSYGLNVARLAGLPNDVIQRAASFAARMEADHERRLIKAAPSQAVSVPGSGQLTGTAAAVLKELRAALGPMAKGGSGGGGTSDVVQLWQRAQAVM